MTAFLIGIPIETKNNVDDAWRALTIATTGVSIKAANIVDEARRAGLRLVTEKERDNALVYALRFHPRDEVVRIKMDSDRREVTISSVIKTDIEVKEHLLRAFCRIVILEMHKLGLDVTFASRKE